MEEIFYKDVLSIIDIYVKNDKMEKLNKEFLDTYEYKIYDEISLGCEGFGEPTSMVHNKKTNKKKYYNYTNFYYGGDGTIESGVDGYVTLTLLKFRDGELHHFIIEEMGPTLEKEYINYYKKVAWSSPMIFSKSYF